MAIIAGVTVNWQLSPRVIFIPSTYEEITIRDLQDTLKDLEDDVEGILWADLRATSGGEDLGGGVSVGWTMELQNAVIAPAPRQVSLEQGTATTADPLGITLVDNAASFVTNGIVAGASVINYTDGSVASVISVDSETQLRMVALSDGIDNTWETGDVYKAWNEVQFNITGGNLVAVDELGVTTSPILSTWGNEILKTSSASATTQELGAIQYSSYGNGVSIDVINGVAGTTYPIGTQQSPVNNLADAVTIANSEGFRTLFIRSSMTLDGVIDIEGFVVQGLSHTATNVVVGTDLLTQDTRFESLNITSGVLDGNSEISNCMIGNLTYFNGHIHDCGLYGTITLDGNSDATIASCITVDQDNSPTIDMGGTGNSLSLPNYSGLMTIINLSDATSEVGVGLNAGSVELDSTITAGLAIIAGVGLLTDNSTGTTIVNSDGLINKSNIASAVQEEIGAEIQYSAYQGVVTIDTVNGIAGTVYPVGTAETPVDNMVDAHDIAEALGFSKFVFQSNYTFGSGINFSDGYEFEGQGLQKTVLTFTDGCQLLNSEVFNARATGSPSGIVGWTDCHLHNLSYSNVAASSADILIHQCQLHSITTFADNFTGTVVVTDSWALPDTGIPPIYDMNNAAFDLEIRNLSGFIKLQNCTQPNDVRIFLVSGGIELENTVTDGEFLFTGVGSLVDGSTGTAQVNSKDLLQASLVTDIKYSVESLRPHHTGTGTMYFWDPENGDDSHDGTVAGLAKKTFAAVYALVTDGNHDVITCISSISGQTTVDEQLVLDKNFTFLRGPGRDFRIQSSHLTQPAITITGQGVEVSSLIVETNAAGTANCIHVTDGSDFSFFDSLWSNECGGDILYYDGSSAYSRVLNCFFSHSGDVGIHIDGDIRHTKIEGTELDASGGDGIAIEGTTARNNIIGDGVKVYASGGYGLNISSPSLRNFIDVDADIYGNTLGEILDNGIETRYGKANIAELNWTGIYLDSANGVSGLVYPRGTAELPSNNLSEAKEIAVIRGVNTIFILGDYNFSGTDILDGYHFVGESSTISDVSVASGASTIGTRFQDINLSTGYISGHCNFIKCNISDLFGVGGAVDDTSFSNCILDEGTVTIDVASTKEISFYDCYSGVPGGSTPVLDFNNSSSMVAFRNYSGGIQVENATQGQNCSFDFVSGQIKFEPSVTDINAVVRGNVKIVENSTSGVIDRTSVLLPETAFNDARVTIDVLAGSTGDLFPLGTPTYPLNNIIDAHAMATSFNLRGYTVAGTIVLDSTYSLWAFYGTSSVTSDVIVCPGYPLENVKFNRCVVAGNVNGTSLDLQECIMSGGIVGFDGLINNTGLDGSLQVKAGGALLGKAASGVSAVSTVDLSQAGAVVALHCDDGNWLYTNAGPTNFIQTTLANGTVTLDASCTGGVAVISGSCNLINNSTMTVIDDTFGAEVTNRVWDRTVETGVSTSEAIQVLLATLAGEASGGGTSTIEFKNPAGDATRVTMTVDTDGNRSAISLTP